MLTTSYFVVTSIVKFLIRTCSCKSNDDVNFFELNDVWANKHEEFNGYTWCNGNDVPYSRIDYVLVSNDFHYCLEKIIVRRIPGSHSGGNRMSDHRALRFTFTIMNNIRGNGYWKLNSSYLDNDDFKTVIKQICTKVTGMEDIDAIDKWEIFKIKVKDFLINFAKHFRNDIKTKIFNIEKEISKIEESDSSHFDMNRKRQLELQLSSIYDDKCKGAQIRSRAKWIKEGEKNTKYFFGLEKKHQSHNIINELNADQNGTVYSNNDILGEMCNFYENLNSTKHVKDDDIDSYLSTLNIGKILSEKDKEYCDTFPSLAECEEAVKTNKSPALDGLTSEFYKTFWGDLKYLFYNSLKKIYENKEMSFSQRLAVMTLVHTKGDTKLLKNYRPISLTNTDYKIIAFVFARRLQNIIDKLISKNQSAYIKGRFIGENARLILDIFDYCEENNYDGILLFLGF